MDTLLKLVFSLILVVVGLGSAWYLRTNAPEVKNREIETRIQTVAVKEFSPRRITIPVYSRGEVTPSTEIQLVLEVAGVVTHIAPHFANGGFFKKGELLLRVDDSRYRLDITKAKARVVSAEEKLRRLRMELSIDEDIEGLPSPKQYRDQQLREGKAQLEAAKADYRLVSIQLEKTTLVAPFDGRVRRALVGVGQYVSPGLQLAQVYPVDMAEIRLPLTDRQLALVNISARPDQVKHLPKVTFKLNFGDQDYFWQGKIVRTEGGLDVKNRVLYAIAQISNPYQADDTQPNRPPLAAGQFLEAEIEGRTHDNIMVLPRKALRNGNEIWVVEKGRLRQRAYQTLYKDKHSIFINKGIERGDLVVMTPMDVTVEGMQVRTQRQDSTKSVTVANQPSRYRSIRAEPKTAAQMNAG